MKKNLLFAAVLCGLTSFAVEAPAPVAVWNGDFNTTTKDDYTLSANGNTVAADGSTITISTQKGVTFARSSALGSAVGMTVIYKFDNLVVGSTVKTIATASAGGGNADRVGVNVQTSGQTSGIWENTKTHNTSATQTTIPSIASDGQFALVYGPAVSNNTGTYLYLKNGTADYTLSYSCGGLKGGNDTVQAMTVGGTRNNGTTFPAATDMVIKAVALFDQALTHDQIAAYTFPEPPPKVEPVMLINITKSSDATAAGWINHYQSGGGGNLPTSGNLSDSTSGASFVATGSGNFYPQSDPTVDFGDGNFVDIFGSAKTSISDEVTSSLGLSESVVFDNTIYSTGVQNGGVNGHTATISGLSVGKKYVVYVGQGRQASKTSGISLQTSGYVSDDTTAFEYVKTGSTAAATAYQTFTPTQGVVSDTNGLIIFRLTNIQPNQNGQIVFSLIGSHSGLNFLAVAKVNETVTYTTAELEYTGDVTISGINKDLTETNNKAEVTIPTGATVYFDEALSVPTKLICEGSITLSAAEKPDLTKLDLSGVEGGVVRTWMTEAEKKGIGFNFAKGCGPNTDQAFVETAWYDNAKNNNGTDCAFSSDGLTTITYTSKNIYNDAGNSNDDSNGTLVKGYLDDGNGVSITVKNVPFAEYAVIIYASTDESGKTLSFKKVNGVAYTYDSANKDVAKTGEDAWGACQSSSTVEYGRNAIRVVAQKNGTLTIESKRDDSKNVRGCVSAIQIVPYTTFIAPTVKIAAVETKCSEDYSANTITGTIADYVANSWEGEIAARVVVNSTVYSAIINDETFLIEVSGLSRENVYRTVLEIGYTDGGIFNAVTTQPIALYQGERQFVWIASPITLKEAATINAAEGCTINPVCDSPDYIDACDSIYSVTLSASEAVEATADTELDGNEQGGLRLVKVDEKTVKLEYLYNDESDSTVKWGDQWPKGTGLETVTLALDQAITVRVEFHYSKGEEGDSSYVKYSIGEDYATSVTSWATAKKVTEVFISDGTVLPDDLKGLFQLDSAVVVDIELKPGEGDTIDYTSVEAANAALETLKVGICDAVMSVLTTTEAQETYRKYFQLVVVPSTTLEGGFSVKTEFTTAAKTEIEDELEDELEKVAEAFNSVDGKAEIAAKPGLYYGVKRGETLEAMSVKEDLQMAGANGKVTIKITKPEGAAAHFYRIIVSPTPETK